MTIIYNPGTVTPLFHNPFPCVRYYNTCSELKNHLDSGTFNWRSSLRIGKNQESVYRPSTLSRLRPDNMEGVQSILNRCIKGNLLSGNKTFSKTLIKFYLRGGAGVRIGFCTLLKRD